ncbi:MAG: DUF1573 domain-containing protein [Saprospiraceae bacterium]
MKKIIYLICCLLPVIACQEEKAPGIGEKSVSEIKASDRISNIIRNPVTAGDEVDTINVAKMVFKETSFNFGSVDEGSEIEHTFKFTNTGKVNLLISNAKSTCGCTVPKWPEYPIAPGQSDEIRVLFKTEGKKDYQSKPVTIFANTYPSETKVYMKGNVIPSMKKK